MSPSNSTIAASETLSQFSLEITAADAAAEIFVMTGDFFLVDRGVGRLVTKPLSPGIYKVKAKVNDQVWEQHVTLTQPGQKVTIPLFQFSSAAPLADTAKTHEYQVAAAESESRKIHYQLGQGSCICVFVREWRGKTPSGPPPATRPLMGLSLCDASEQEKVAFETTGKVDNSVPDPWGACTIAVNPGVYILRLTLPTGARYERTIVAAPGWQTQVFLLMSDYGAVRCADLVRGSVLMARGLGFSNADRSLRQIELARMALANERKVLKGETLEMLHGKFDNPMLGILGGHLLLLDVSPDLALLKIVVNNLRGVLNFQHPDVEALALAAGIGSQYVFTVPPMLRRSWALVVNATADRHDLVPSGCLADRSARNQWAVEPWLAWDMRDAIPGAADIAGTKEDFKVALQMRAFAAPAPSSSSSSASDSPFEAVRMLRAKTPKSRDFLAAPAPPSATVSVDPSKMGDLVRSLGVPRSTLEGMVQQMTVSGPAKSGAPAVRTGWCFAWPVAPRTVDGKDKAALVKGSRWNSGDAISVSFLDGDAALQERVKQAALIWTGPKLANLAFDFRKDTNDTLIRISFRYPGSWSSIGTTCKRLTGNTRPTMNFGWLTPQSTDDEVRGVVLHEFGHALGLIHEHQSPSASDIKWNRDAIIRDLSGPPNNWTIDDIEHNMFEAFAASETNFSALDPSSIMMYPIPPQWTLNGFSVGLNQSLSTVDQEFIRSQYP
jgi:serralysin